MDLLVFKRGLLQHLLSVTLAKAQSVPAEIRAKLTAIVASREEFRKHMGYQGFAPPDMGWRAGWPASADSLLSIFEVGATRKR